MRTAIASRRTKRAIAKEVDMHQVGAPTSVRDLPPDRGFGVWGTFISDLDEAKFQDEAVHQGSDPNPIGRTQEEEFKELADWWHDDTDPLSVEAEIIDHPAYWRIVAKGKAMVPYILGDLQTRGGLWFRALEAIEEFSLPFEKENGNISTAREAWLAWGRDNHLIG